MKKQLIGFVLPLLICVLTPLGAVAELSIIVVHSPGSGDPGDWLTFIVEVREDGSPASGQTVTFSVSPDNGTLSFLGGTSTGTTGDNGRASKTLVLGSDASGSYTVTASVGSVSVSRTATVETPPLPPDEPPTRTLYRVESVPFHPGDTVTFGASVRQVKGGVNQGVSGETVTFSVSPDDGTASLSTTSATTDSNGEARTTLTLSSSASGSYRVTATFGDGTSKTHSTGTVYNPSEDEEEPPPPPPPPPPPELSIAVVHSPGSGDPGDWLTFIVEVREDGSPASGKTVTFSVSPDDGTLSFLGGTSTGTTGDNGRASKTLVLGSDASSSYTVTASVGSVSVSRTATVETPPLPPEEGGPPTRTLYRVESVPFHPGDTVTFTASVRAVRGGVNQGVSGETVTFSLSPDDGTASLSTTSATTDSNGEARTTLTLSSSASGSYRVTATFGDGTSKTHSTGTVYNPSIPLGFIIGMRYRSSPINPGESMTFTVDVQKDGNRISDQTVTFSVSPDDGTVSLSPTSATTDSDGQASTTLSTGSNSSGSYTVTASLGSQSISGTATVETSPPQDDSGEDQQFTATTGEPASDSQEDPEPDPQLESLSVTIDDVTSAAERGRMTFTVRLEPPPTAPTTVKYATASQTATAGQDYEAATGTLHFGANQNTATFTVRIRPDEQAEPNETFGVRITHPSTRALLAEATGTITDDDGATPPEGDSDEEMADGEEADGERAFGFAGKVEDQAYTAGAAISALVLPEAIGGEGEVTYRVSDVPAGLAFDAATRTISGTPEAATDGAVEITYTAEDSAGEVATLTFSITVNPALSFGDLFDLFGAGGG